MQMLVEKWQLLTKLRTAQKSFGISVRRNDFDWTNSLHIDAQSPASLTPNHNSTSFMAFGLQTAQSSISSLLTCAKQSFKMRSFSTVSHGTRALSPWSSSASSSVRQQAFRSAVAPARQSRSFRYLHIVLMHSRASTKLIILSQLRPEGHVAPVLNAV
jgi:hypothetical protein